MATKILIKMLVLMSTYTDVEKDLIRFVCSDPRITNITVDSEPFMREEFHSVTIHFTTSGEEYDIEPYNMGLNTMQLQPFDPAALEVTVIARTVDWELTLYPIVPRLELNVRGMQSQISFEQFGEE